MSKMLRSMHSRNPASGARAVCATRAILRRVFWQPKRNLLGSLRFTTEKKSTLITMVKKILRWRFLFMQKDTPRLKFLFYTAPK